MTSNDSNVTAAAAAAASQQPGGRATSSRHVKAASLALKLIVLSAVMVAAYLAFSVGLWGTSPMNVAAAAEPEDRPSATGVKDAIQDLYAEIKAAESDGSGLAADSLDVATSAKAQYVSDSLRRMVSGGGGVDEPAGRDGPVVGHDGDHVSRSVDRFATATVPAKDRRRADSRPRHDDPPPPLSREEVNELVQRFFDRLEHFDRLKSSSPATTIVGEPRHGIRVQPSATRPRNGRGLLATKSTPVPGLFKLAMFNRHRVTPYAR